jgi:rhomboid protease GluP
MDIVNAIILINSLVFILPFLVNFAGSGGNSFMYFLSLGWKSNPDIADGEYYRLLTASFLHGGVFHLFVNMYSLLQLGPNILRIFSPAGFVIVYLSSGIVGNLFSYWFNVRPSVGASGAIMGLFGAMLAYGVKTGDFSSFGVIFLNLAIIALYGFGSSYIDNWGHFGGLIGGFVLGLAISYTRIVNF